MWLLPLEDLVQPLPDAIAEELCYLPGRAWVKVKSRDHLRGELKREGAIRSLVVVEPGTPVQICNGTLAHARVIPHEALRRMRTREVTG